MYLNIYQWTICRITRHWHIWSLSFTLSLFYLFILFVFIIVMCYSILKTFKWLCLSHHDKSWKVRQWELIYIYLYIYTNKNWGRPPVDSLCGSPTIPNDETIIKRHYHLLQKKKNFFFFLLFYFIYNINTISFIKCIYFSRHYTRLNQINVKSHPLQHRIKGLTREHCQDHWCRDAWRKFIVYIFIYPHICI